VLKTAVVTAGKQGLFNPVVVHQIADERYITVDMAAGLATISDDADAPSSINEISRNFAGFRPQHRDNGRTVPALGSTTESSIVEVIPLDLNTFQMAVFLASGMDGVIIGP